jgi:hypothetical protein
VVAAGGRWSHPGLRISLPAPDEVISGNSGRDMLERAQAAADAGLANVIPVRGQRRIPPPAVLPTTRSVPLKNGLAAATLQTIRIMADAVRWGLVAAVVSALAAVLLQNPVLTVIAAAIALFCISLVLHEAGHVAAYRLAAPRSAGMLVVAGPRFRLVRRPDTSGRDLLITLAGPAATVLLPLALLPAAGTVPISFWLSAAVCSGHLYPLLLPHTGDGLALRQAMTARRKPRSGHK